jgi:hypothetical protein
VERSVRTLLLGGLEIGKSSEQDGEDLFVLLNEEPLELLLGCALYSMGTFIIRLFKKNAS